MTRNRPNTTLRLLALLLSFLLLAAACGGDDGDDAEPVSGDDGDDMVETDDSDGDDMADDGDMDDDADDMDDDADDGDMADDDMAEPEPEPEPRTASWRGITEDTITVGVAMLNFELLVDINLSPAGWGDQQGVWEALIANLNANGGINGRTVEAVYEYYSPIDPVDAERVCTALTEDNEVFAVLGGFVGPLAGTADPCITGLNETILIGGEINAAELAQSRAPWYHPSATIEFSTDNLLGLLVETGRLTEGMPVYVIAGRAAEATVDPVVEAFEARGANVVGRSIIEANDGETLAQNQQMEVILERFKESGAEAIMIPGNPAATIRGIGLAGLNGQVPVWNNNPGGLNNLGETITDKSIADGVLTSLGPTDTEIYEDSLYQSACNDVVAAAMPDADLRPPTDYAEGEENWFNPVRRYCRHLALFVEIATAAGVNPTHDSFRAGAESLTDFALPGGAASLSATKLGADDLVRLAAYDHTEGDGQTVPVTDLIDVFP
ncbi:MAG: ABC transporter substrate-binding protein [Acidimicrobiaceae bacterium]|nr:ABC transporter substrate-binding protein [Acidimicrobiaceae bacterium]